jgi:uncharacterized coiled-coil protein SlyX
LATENVKLQSTDAKLTERLVALEASCAEQSTTIAKLADMVKQTNTACSGTVEHAVKKLKDNTFNVSAVTIHTVSRALTQIDVGVDNRPLYVRHF